MELQTESRKKANPSTIPDGHGTAWNPSATEYYVWTNVWMSVSTGPSSPHKIETGRRVTNRMWASIFLAQLFPSPKVYAFVIVRKISYSAGSKRTKVDPSHWRNPPRIRHLRLNHLKFFNKKAIGLRGPYDWADLLFSNPFFTSWPYYFALPTRSLTETHAANGWHVKQTREKGYKGQLPVCRRGRIRLFSLNGIKCFRQGDPIPKSSRQIPQKMKWVGTKMKK